MMDRWIENQHMEVEIMIWIILGLLGVMWLTPYTLGGLVPSLFAIAVLLYLYDLFAENQVS